MGKQARRKKGKPAGIQENAGQQNQTGNGDSAAEAEVPREASEAQGTASKGSQESGTRILFRLIILLAIPVALCMVVRLLFL